GINKNETIGAMKNTTVAMDMMTIVTGKLTEIIDGDMVSETKKERILSSNGKIVSQSEGTHEQHSKKEVQNNSAEKSKIF
ncbi:type IV secretion protein Rhs, partial [Flavobacterium columnare]